MRILFSIILISLWVLPSMPAAHGQPNVQELGVTSISLDIAAPNLANHDSTEVVVYLPSIYYSNSERIFPVVFFLHGQGSDAGSFGRLNGAQAIASLLDNEEFVVVSVTGESSGYMNWADGQSLWEDHLLHTVSDEISSSFRVSSERELRGLYGVSMGGLAALRIAMTHNDKFGCVASHFAAISPVDFDQQPEWQRTGFLAMEDFNDRYGNPFDSSLWREVNPLHIASVSDLEELRSVKFYFDVGIDDALGFDDDNAALSQVLSEKGIPHTFSLRSGGHDSEFIRANMGKAMQFLAECLLPK